jgi:hypothetical protein
VRLSLHIGLSRNSGEGLRVFLLLTVIDFFPVGDYVAGFLGVSEGNAFGLDAFNPIKLKDGSVVTRGLGNHCSVEFNMLYRVGLTLSCL